MIAVFLIISSVLFLLLFVVWRMSDAFNAFLKFVFAAMTVLGVLSCLFHYGVLKVGG